MRTISVGKNKDPVELPTTWAEGEKMITAAIKQFSGRGGNQKIMSVCAQIAFGLTGDQSLAPDPTTALAYLIQRICQRKGAGLER